MAKGGLVIGYCRNRVERFPIVLFTYISREIKNYRQMVDKNFFCCNLIIVNFLKKYQIKPIEVLISVYIFGIVVVNLMGAKVMPLGQIGNLKFNISVAIFLMPFLYTIIDCVSEVYGRNKARSIVFLGLICIVLLLAFMGLAIALPHAERFESSNPAYELIFGTSLRLALASVIAFFVSEITDVFIYSKLKTATKGKMIWLRNNVSNIVGEFADSLVFMTVAFYAFNKSFGDNMMWVLGLTIPYWLAKCVMSFVSTPLVYLGVKYLKTEKNEGGGE
jgi:uncharacterized integral membrane protein (TIGR00697 family)